MQINDWIEIAGAGIFNAAEWQRYCAGEALHCGCTGLLAAVFLGCFVIGQRAKSRREARRAEGVMLLVLAVVWAAGVIGLHIAVAVALEQTFFELVLLAALVAGGGVCLLYTSHRKIPISPPLHAGSAGERSWEGVVKCLALQLVYWPKPKN